MEPKPDTPIDVKSNPVPVQAAPASMTKSLEAPSPRPPPAPAGSQQHESTSDIFSGIKSPLKSYDDGVPGDGLTRLLQKTEQLRNNIAISQHIPVNIEVRLD